MDEERGGAGRVLSGLGWDVAGIGNGEVLECCKFGMLSYFLGGTCMSAVCARFEGCDVGGDGVWMMIVVMVMGELGEFG